MNGKKLKISVEELVEVLEYCLLIPLTEKSVKKTAQTIGFQIKSSKDFSRIRDELYYLGMWLVVLTCEKIFKNEHKRSKYLDAFHHHIYGDGVDFESWMTMISDRYSDYTRAVQVENTLGLDWALARVVNKNMFGRINEDPVIQTSLGLHIISFTTHLEQSLKKLIGNYDIG